MNILVFAFQLHPTKGSECAVAWDYITSMSKFHKIHVIYGSCEGYHEIGNTAYMEEYTKYNLIDNTKFIPFKPSFISKNYGYNAFETLFFYNEYKKYHKEVYCFAKEYIKKHNIDLIHYLGPIGYHEPGYLYNLDVPYIWGPIGGFSNINFRLLPGTFSIKGGLNLIIKSLMNIIQCYSSRRLKHALKSASLVIASTTEAQKIIQKISPVAHVSYLPENCIKELHQLNFEKFSAPIIRLIWIGRLDSNKGLSILLKSLSLLPKNSPIELNIVGDGPLEHKMIEYAKLLDIMHFIKWHGRIARDKIYELLDISHLHIITSLNDANTTVVWEAMSMGVPTLSLDHRGMHDTIDSHTGIKIPIISYKQTVKGIANQLINIINNPEILHRLAVGVINTRDKYTWNNRVSIFNELYEKAIQRYNTHKNKFFHS